MSRWTDAMIREALDLATPAVPLVFSDVGTDSRTIAADQLFVALCGERFDAHAFLGNVAERGVKAAVVSHVPQDAPAGLHYYVVDDTLKALGRLGRYRRRRLGVRVCAVTGSNGKTTTKEMLRAVLGVKYRVHATTGNLNNQVGTPLTLLATPDDAEVVVAELGTSLPGEIEILGDIVEPDAAVVTAVSEEHLEGLGSLEGVLKEEVSILDAVDPAGFAVVADEPAELPEAARSHSLRVKVAGWTERADEELRARDVHLDSNGEVHFRWQNSHVHVPLRGRHNARNALIALGVALEWGISIEEAIGALAQLKPAKMRGEVHQYGELIVIADCYNANPASTAAALDLLVSMPRERRKVAVLGSMLEMGSVSADVHARVAREAASLDIDVIVATGEFVDAFRPLASQVCGELILESDPMNAVEPLLSRLRGDEIVLLKGSRGVALERLLPHLENYGSAPPPRGGRKAGGEKAHRDVKTTSSAEHSHD